MICGERVVNPEQIRNELLRDGFEPATPAYVAEMDRRYTPVDDGVYAENPLWDGTRGTPSDYG